MIVSENNDPLISKIKSDLNRWNLVPFLGLGQRVEAIKTNVLLRLLYLFQNVPAEIPKGNFQELDKVISRFVWQGKRPKTTGGLSLPNIYNYDLYLGIRSDTVKGFENKYMYNILLLASKKKQSQGNG